MRRSLLLAAAAAALTVGAISSQAYAQSTPLALTAHYFTVNETKDADFNTEACCIAPSDAYTNEALPGLGPDDLPVYNVNYNSGDPNDPYKTNIQDVNSKGEITWWSPTDNPNVTATGSGVVTLPYDNESLYPPNGTGSSDYNGFQTAIFSGELVVPTEEQVQFSFGADDDAFLALNGQIISQEGGIHGDAAAPVVTPTLDPGTYSLDLFYADRHNSGAGLYFSVNTADVTVAPISGAPEPAEWLLLMLGVGGLGLAFRRRSRSEALAYRAVGGGGGGRPWGRPRLEAAEVPCAWLSGVPQTEARPLDRSPRGLSAKLNGRHPQRWRAGGGPSFRTDHPTVPRVTLRVTDAIYVWGRPAATANASPAWRRCSRRHSARIKRLAAGAAGRQGVRYQHEQQEEQIRSCTHQRLGGDPSDDGDRPGEEPRRDAPGRRPANGGDRPLDLPQHPRVETAKRSRIQAPPAPVAAPRSMPQGDGLGLKPG